MPSRNTKNKQHPIYFAFCAIVFTFPVIAAAEGPQVAVDPHSGQIVFTEKGEAVLQYNYKTIPIPEGLLEQVAEANKIYAVPRSNYIHPLYGLDGETLTCDWSKDHPHHRGIYWAWPEVGYQGELGDMHALQKIFPRPTGKVSMVNETGFAEVKAENLWKWEDKTPIIRETVTIRVYPTNVMGRKVDLQLEFTALKESVTLARRDMEDYGGLNIRLNRMEKLKLDGYRDEDNKSPQRAWTLASGLWKGTKDRTEITVFEKASNPCYPGDFVKYPFLPWFQPAFPKAKIRYEIKKGRTLTLNYQLWIHRSGTSMEQYHSQWDHYQEK